MAKEDVSVGGPGTKGRSLSVTIPLRLVVWQVACERAESSGLSIEHWLAEVVECYMVQHDYIRLFAEMDTLRARRRKLLGRYSNLKTRFTRFSEEVESERARLQAEIGRLVDAGTSRLANPVKRLQGKLDKLFLPVAEKERAWERARIQKEMEGVTAELEKLKDDDSLQAERARLLAEDGKLRANPSPAVAKQSSLAKDALAERSRLLSRPQVHTKIEGSGS